MERKARSNSGPEPPGPPEGAGGKYRERARFIEALFLGTPAKGRQKAWRRDVRIKAWLVGIFLAACLVDIVVKVIRAILSGS